MNEQNKIQTRELKKLPCYWNHPCILKDEFGEKVCIHCPLDPEGGNNTPKTKNEMISILDEALKDPFTRGVSKFMKAW